AEFTSPQSPIVTTTTPWSALASPPAPLEFSAEGQGHTIDFEEPVGEPLAKVPLGSIVIVTVQITTPDSLDATTVRVLMPGGLEPVDPNTAGGSAGICDSLLRDGDSFSSFPINCPDQETLPSAVTFRYDFLDAGTHVLSLRAVAATPGAFGLPPASAFVNSQPELMGLSAAGTFEVCDGEGCEAAAREAPQSPKGCPQDCNGSGLCDLDEGTCLCFEGFEGEACGSLAEA
ncbi:unnamed protein product, partial [Ostreobium quekettii]